MSDYFALVEQAKVELYLTSYDEDDRPTDRLPAGVRPLLTVRCSRERHRLARVLVTSYGPLLVPEILMHGRGRRPEPRAAVGKRLGEVRVTRGVRLLAIRHATVLAELDPIPLRCHCGVLSTSAQELFLALAGASDELVIDRSL